MNRESSPLFVKENLYKGLKDYMAEIGDEYINIKLAKPLDISGIYLICRNCGSNGPFKISSKDFVSKNQGYDFKDVHESMTSISNLKCNVFTNQDGSLRFQMVGRPTFDIERLAEYLGYNCDTYITQLLECPRCDFQDVEVAPDGGMIDWESFEFYGDSHFLCDNPTEFERDDEGKIIHEEITRDGVMLECFNCYSWDELMEHYEEVGEDEEARKAKAMEKDEYGSLCARYDIGCSIARSFWLFRISPRELVEKYHAWGREKIEEEKRKNAN